MKNAVIITTRAFSTDFKSLYEQMHFLGAEYDNIYLIHGYTTERVVKHIKEIAGINIEKSFSFSEDLENIAVKHMYKTWREYYNSIDLSCLEGIEIHDVWMFGAPLSAGGYLKRGMHGLQKNFEKHQYMKFLSVAKLYMINYIAIRVANNKNAVYREMSYDPGEASINEVNIDPLVPKRGFKVYHGYDIVDLGMEKHTSYQTGLTSVATIFPFATKDYDLTFGYSYMTIERKKDHDLMQRVYDVIRNNIKGKLLYRSKIDDINLLVEKDEYMSLIAESRFTFIIPAYKSGVFSCYRFIESIHYDCLPLIFDHCNYEEFFKSYDINTDVVQEIVINEHNVLDKLSMTEERRIEIIKYMKEKLF